MRNCRAVLMLVATCLFGSSLAVAAELPKVPLVATPPKLDGDLSDAAWEKSAELKLGGYCDVARRKKGEKPKDATAARVCSDKDNLYLSFTCAESHPEGPYVLDDARAKRRINSHVWGGDYVAVMVDMGRWGFFNYYSIAVNAKGEVYRSFTWPQRYDLIIRDVEMPDVKAAAKVEKGKKWTVELSIPLKTMLRHPADGLPKRLGLDLRRVQWGADRGKGKFKVYWTGMVCVSGKTMNGQYERMSTWTPLFDKFPDYPNVYAAGRGWAQLIFPESFGHVELEAGKIDNQLVSGQGKRLLGLISSRSGWSTKKADRDRYIAAFDKPRMESPEDLRKMTFPEEKPVVAKIKPPARTGAVTFKQKPLISTADGKTRISFELSAAADVTVAVLGAKGRIVRHLGGGVLGANAPEPFKKGSLAQELIWDGTDDFGKKLPAGSYKVKVSAGLKPVFDRTIPLKKDYWSADKTPTAKGLDIDSMPAPKIGKSLGHFSRGTMNYLSVDRNTEELYVQTREIYDGRTGKKLRDLKLEPPRVFQLTKGTGNGEIVISPLDNLLYAGGPNEVWRFSRDGKKAPFSSVGRHFIPELWGAHSNPHRGICVDRAGNVYKVHHLIPHSSTRNQVTRIDSAGRITDYAFIRVETSAAGVRVDSRGNVYVGCTAQPADALPHPELAKKMPERPRKLFKNVYGSIVKFGREGGAVSPDAKGDVICPDYRSRPKPYSIRGAKWIRPGFSPMLSRVSDSKGGPGCSCRNGRFDLDGYDRLFIPDAVSGRIDVVDSSGNTIALIGGRGEAGKKSGIEFGWATQVAVSDEACYVADYLRFRISRIKLTYEAESEVPVSVK